MSARASPVAAAADTTSATTNTATAAVDTHETLRGQQPATRRGVAARDGGNGWLWYAYVFAVIVSVALILYAFAGYAFRRDRLERQDRETAEKLREGPLQNLLNGSGINNIPRLNIVRASHTVTAANNCARGPVYLGDRGNDSDCVRLCANSTASAITVRPGETYVNDSSVLRTGVHCVLGEPPQCNMRTSYAMMTVNSITCRSKFPRLVGGPYGTTVVACNNRLYNDQRNVLWDRRYQRPFDPLTTVITDETERLPDGKRRFGCKFNGLDDRGNRYIRHPLDRYHPIRNICARNVYRAHPSVKTKFDLANGRVICDCGDPAVTRVRNLVPGDESTPCVNVQRTVRDDTKDRKVLTLPYNCFTMFSTLDDVGRYMPCPSDQFTRQGSQMTSVSIPFSANKNALIEHPLYAEFPGTTKVSLMPGTLLS